MTTRPHVVFVIIATCLATSCGPPPLTEARVIENLGKDEMDFQVDVVADACIDQMVVAFPANEFGGQEPGTDEDIRSFCKGEYDVTFPLFSKIVVKGEGKHPLYQELTKQQPEARSLPDTDFRGNLVKYGIDPGPKEEVLWNFEKFLVDRNGTAIARFSPDVEPDASILVTAIEAAINAPG